MAQSMAPMDRILTHVPMHPLAPSLGREVFVRTLPLPLLERLILRLLIAIGLLE